MSLLLRSPFLAALLVTAAPLPAAAPSAFRPTPDHEPRAGVPTGTVLPQPAWSSQVFPGTTRDWWLYVPAQYQPDGTAAVMIFQDGANYLRPTGQWRAPVVLDNLIARGEMPVTLAIFINPGHDPSKGAPKRPGSPSNRSLEYNSLGDRYARFLLEEILPAVAKTHPFSADPERRALVGSSSGGIAAFTAAWERPDQFRKVLSTIGSFVHLAGGDAYPSLIRKTERKPLRVYLEDASGDLDNPYGNWPLANQQMHAALRYMGYDVRFDYAEGYGHNADHGGSLFPDALRWLWRAETHRPEIVTKGDLASDFTLHRLLVEGEGWTKVVDGLAFADAPCTDAAGNFYYSDMRPPAAGVYRLAPDGTRTRLSEEGVSGMKFGPDGRLYACQGAKRRLIAITPATGAVEVLTEDVQPNDLAVTRRGHIFFTETGKKQVTFLDPRTREKRPADTGLANPNGITLSPRHDTLAVSEAGGEHVQVWRVQADGTLDARAPYMTLRRPIDPKGEFKFNQPPPYRKASGGDGMTSDTAGRWYVASPLGVQVFDPTGRLCGVLTKPQADQPLTSCTLSGPGLGYLYVTNGNAIFRRKVQATGNPPPGA
jgi:enterochelin esterase family protein